MKKNALFLIFLIFFSHYANAQDTLKMLIWEGYAPKYQVNIFKNYIEKKYNRPIEIEINHPSAVIDFYNALRSEKFHIISPAHNLIKDERFSYIKNKLIMPIDLKYIPNYKYIIQSLQSADYITDAKGNIYGVPFIHGPYALIYNTKYFSSPPKSWAILWDKKYKNNYAISSDYYEANIYITALLIGLEGSEISDFSKLRENDIFKKKLEQLALNVHTLWKGVDTAKDLKGLALATSWGFSLDELKKNGEVWKIADPKEGTTGWVDNFVLSSSLLDKPFLKKVAHEWLNFTLSSQFQVNVVVRQLLSIPVNGSIKKLLTQEEVLTYHINDINYFEEKRILWPILKEHNYSERDALHNLWKRAIKNKSKP